MEDLEKMEIMLNKYYNLTKEFEHIRELRKNIDMNKYYKLQEINKNDSMYKWAFENSDVLYEDLDDLLSAYYHAKYIHDIGLTYIEILEKCQK